MPANVGEFWCFTETSLLSGQCVWIWGREHHLCGFFFSWKVTLLQIDTCNLGFPFQGFTNTIRFFVSVFNTFSQAKWSDCGLTPFSVAGSSYLMCVLAGRERSIWCCGSSGCWIPDITWQLFLYRPQHHSGNCLSKRCQLPLPWSQSKMYLFFFSDTSSLFINSSLLLLKWRHPKALWAWWCFGWKESFCGAACIRAPVRGPWVLA